MGVRIAGVGHYAPTKILSNQDFEKMFDTSDEWITTRTGMQRRHVSAPNEATSDLAIVAARNALADAGVAPTDIDCYVVCTATPDYAFPATACLVASALGATGKAGFDLEVGCSGFVYGLTVASGLIRSGVFKKVVLIGAETLTKITDYSDRSTAVLFGDGAGAVVLEASEQDSFLASELGSDGADPTMLYLPSGGSRSPFNEKTLAERGNFLKMRGSETFKFAVTKMAESATTAIARAGLAIDDVAYFIPHQANKRIIDATAKTLSLPPEKVVVNIADYGNTSAATIPIALSEMSARGDLHDGDVLVMVAFGAGMSWGAVAWRWTA